MSSPTGPSLPTSENGFSRKPFPCELSRRIGSLMKPKTSAGLLLYRVSDQALQVFLAHPGGPLWAKKDLGAWSIPKGEFDPVEEEALAAAQREFAEETGQR